VNQKKRTSQAASAETDAYEIRVRGQLSDAIVSGLGADRQGGSETALIVNVRDRAGLHAFMDRVEDFGLEIISINPGRSRKR
jgi:hypothetical protein